MKWFLITLAIGLTTSDKLDLTYLPPPGAQFAGGNLGNHDAPLEPPHHPHSGPIVTGQPGPQPNYGLNGEPANFGDKIPKVPFNSYTEKVPITTTSYAFSQTTTYPPAEGYETTALPVNPVTGLPGQIGQANYPHGPSQGQQNTQNYPGFNQIQGPGQQIYGTNIQQIPSQAPTSSPTNYGTTVYDQSGNPPINQYPGQNIYEPGGATQVPGSVYQSLEQNQGQFQYPGIGNTAQQGTVTPTDFNQYSGQNVVVPGGVVQIPGGSQGLAQYPGQQEFVTSTASPTSLQPGGNQFGTNYDGPQGPISQGTYTGQPINVQSLGGPQPTQTSYQNQEPLNIGGVPSQYPIGNQNLLSGSGGSGSITSSIPKYYDGVSSTTPIPSSTSSYSSVNRPERPQAAADRNAVILNYENVRTPNAYSYSFDTSNGIHADESGVVDNGTKAQGSYSYTGDDGKVYSVFYTADENGFQPRGDHLPTPPPIPEAIQRVIEQAARDKAAGIFDDGSYDEAKYGDKKYQGTTNRRRPQNKSADRLGNKQYTDTQSSEPKPIAGIYDDSYEERIPQGQVNNLQGTRKDANGKLTAGGSSNQINGDSKIFESNRRVSEKEGFDESGMPITEEGIENFNEYGKKKAGLSERRPTNEINQSAIDKNINREIFGSPESYQTTGKIKDVNKKYPGLHVDVSTAKYPGSNGDRLDNSNIYSGSPGVSNENIDTLSDSVTSTPINENRKQTLRQRVKENQKPDGRIDGRPRDEGLRIESVKTPTTQQITGQNDNGYNYQSPTAKTEQNKFPNRFRSQKVSPTMEPGQEEEYVEGTTRKPFMTPNIYKQKDRTIQSTTKAPLSTSTTDNSYTDYDDGDDYATGQDNNDDGIDSSRVTAENNGITSRPSTQVPSRTEYTPGTQNTRITQNGIVTPGYRVENSDAGIPGYKFRSTTSTPNMPTHSSRFGSTETSRIEPQPTTAIPISTTAIGKPVSFQSPSRTRPSKYNYGTTESVSKYSGTNVVPGYPNTGFIPAFDSSTPGLSPQRYTTSTYRPSQGYSSTTPGLIPGSRQDSGPQYPVTPTGLPQPIQNGIFQTGYHYGPPKTGIFMTGISSPDRIGTSFFTPPGTFGVTPTTPGSYQQGPGGITTTTPVPGRQGTFILSQPGTAAPQSPPIGTYQGNYQKGLDYATTIVSSSPGGKPGFVYPGSPGANTQETTGYEYGPGPTYSTTVPPSTVGTTPGSFIPITGSSGVPTQGYSTTSRPGFQNTKDIYIGSPVDGFGRPIIAEHAGVSYPTQGSTGPISFGQNVHGAEPPPYPGSYDPSRVIGEDFSGPKQPQRFDPKTGYHYK